MQMSYIPRPIALVSPSLIADATCVLRLHMHQRRPHALEMAAAAVAGASSRSAPLGSAAAGNQPRGLGQAAPFPPSSCRHPAASSAVSNA